MAPDTSRSVRSLTFFLVVVASAGVEIAAIDTRPVLASLGLAAGWIAAALVGSRFVPTPARPGGLPPFWVFAALMVLSAAPFVIEPLRRRWTGDGYALELQMVFALRNVGLCLAVCSGWLYCRRLAAVVSLFLVLFAAAMTNHPAVMVAVALYTLGGCAWLVLAHWDELRSALAVADNLVELEIRDERAQIPWLGLGVLGIALTAACSLAFVDSGRAALTLGEWLPTSGGTGAADPFARYGVGDGPEETAGENARAAGMVETNRMIEDNANSLIDAVSEMYGPPHRPPKEREQMVAAGKVEIIENHGKLPQNRRPNRDFDTSRKGPNHGKKKPSSRAARAVFEIEGRTPLHVRVVAYEVYDADSACWRESPQPTWRDYDADDGCWMQRTFIGEPGRWLGREERHRFKMAEPIGNLVPTPTMVRRFRIRLVDKPWYYEPQYDGVYVLARRETMPPGIVVSTDCRTVVREQLDASAFPTAIKNQRMATLLAVPDGVRSKVERLARSWTEGLERGGPQVEAITSRLRESYILDPDAAPPADHSAPVLWFLDESRRGPDYLFATSACLMLRTLGYPARICLGYYASPDAYDPETTHTPITRADLHVWAETLLEDDDWLVVEATPGYAVIEPRLPWSKVAWNVVLACIVWIQAHAAAIALCAAITVGLWWYRVELLDAAFVLGWTLFPGRSWRDTVRRAVAILERRGRWLGQPRHGRQTVACWLDRTLTDLPVGPDAAALREATTWAAYAPDEAPPMSADAVRAACRRMLAQCSLPRWRRALHSRRSSEPIP
jgi:hypothetical protein